MSRLTIVLSIVVGAAFVVVVAGYGNSRGNSSEPTANPVSVGEHQNHEAHSPGDRRAHQGHGQDSPTAEIAAFLNTQADAPAGHRMAADGQKVCPASGQTRATMAKARKTKATDGGGASCCQGSGPEPCADGHGAPQQPKVAAGASDARQENH